MIGLYAHIPFCDKKCPYCDFYSLPGQPLLFDDYEKAVARALISAPKDTADTVYFGGGTPSFWGASRLCATLGTIKECFDVTLDAEISLEVNPGSIDEAALRTLRQAGFNRVSVGVQSTFDDTLHRLGRRHSAKEALDAVEASFRAGFHHISADLMLAVPGQSIACAVEDIDRLAYLPIDHLSVYLLKNEPGTAFADCAPEPDDKAAELYLACVDRCEAHGLHQYEISNFATCPAAQSKHNMKYWHCDPTLGIGPSAHSFYEGRRFYFPRDLKAFVAAENPWDTVVPDGFGGDDAECIMLGLRLRKGILTDDYPAYAQRLAHRIPMLKKNGLVETGHGRLWLTPRGFLVSNTIITHLLAD